MMTMMTTIDCRHPLLDNLTSEIQTPEESGVRIACEVVWVNQRHVTTALPVNDYFPLIFRRSMELKLLLTQIIINSMYLGRAISWKTWASNLI